MKKTLYLLLCLLAVASFSFALAEGSLETGSVRQLALSDAIDLDGDGSADSISLAFTALDEDGFLSAFTLTVNGVSATGECENAAQTLWALRTYRGDVLLLVPEYGPSDDSYCHCFLMEDDRLIDVGGIPSPAEAIRVAYNAIECEVRAYTLQTWFRPATYVLARNYSYSETEPIPDPVLCEAPQTSYPVGTIVTLKKDIALRVAPNYVETAMVLKAGDLAVLSASDDLSWIYLAPLAQNTQSEYDGGYTAISGMEVETEEGFCDSWETFDGLCFAD